jgi:hypothetical protein
MKHEVIEPLVVTCSQCKFKNVFNQPYAYHAGFSDQGFLYNESGNCTLIWSAFDPAYTTIVGGKNPWSLIVTDREKFESALQPSPDGTRWLFSNPARCMKCSHPVSGPITEAIYYLEYEGSVNVDQYRNLKRCLKDVLSA